MIVHDPREVFVEKKLKKLQNPNFGEFFCEQGCVSRIACKSMVARCCAVRADSSEGPRSAGGGGVPPRGGRGGGFPEGPPRGPKGHKISSVHSDTAQASNNARLARLYLLFHRRFLCSTKLGDAFPLPCSS